MDNLEFKKKQRVAHEPKHDGTPILLKLKAPQIRETDGTMPSVPRVLATGTVTNNGMLPLSSGRRKNVSKKKKKRPNSSDDDEDLHFEIDKSESASLVNTAEGIPNDSNTGGGETSRRNRTEKYRNLNEADLFSDAVLQAGMEISTAEEERRKNREQAMKRKRTSGSASDELDSVVTTAKEVILKIFETEAEENPIPDTLYRESDTILDWDDYLVDPKNFSNVPFVTDFKNAPLSDCWQQIAVVGLGIELRNPYFKGPEDAYWIGTIVHYAGYKALVLFESFGSRDRDYISWISFCSDVPKHLGWCAKNGKKLLPGPMANSISKEMLDENMKLFQQKPTVSEQHWKNIVLGLHRCRTALAKVPMVEALDLHDLDENRVGKISLIVGNRVRVNYLDQVDSKSVYCGEFWFNFKSERLHEFGWSDTVGVKRNGIDQGIKRFPLPRDKFPAYPEEIKIEVGMKLETRHPTRPDRIVGAVVIKVLNYGYFVIKTMDVTRNRRANYVYHVTSPFVYPVGFGSSHGITVEFADNGGSRKTLDLHLLPKRSTHNFKVGMKLEAVDIVESFFISPATIKKVAEHMLLIKFDNFKDIDRNYQWVDTEISDIYPIGYCEMLTIRFHGQVSLD